MDQKFEIVVVLTTACKEVVDSVKVACWAGDLFFGCEMGEVTIREVKEIEQNGTRRVL